MSRFLKITISILFFGLIPLGLVFARSVEMPNQIAIPGFGVIGYYDGWAVSYTGSRSPILVFGPQIRPDMCYFGDFVWEGQTYTLGNSGPDAEQLLYDNILLTPTDESWTMRELSVDGRAMTLLEEWWEGDPDNLRFLNGLVLQPGTEIWLRLECNMFNREWEEFAPVIDAMLESVVWAEPGSAASQPEIFLPNRLEIPGLLSIGYPDGWGQLDDVRISLSNGMSIMSIEYGSSEVFNFEGSSALELVSEFSYAAISEPHIFTIGQIEGASVEVGWETPDTYVHSLFVAIQAPDNENWVVLTFSTGRGGSSAPYTYYFEELRPIIDAMVASITWLDTPVIPETVVEAAPAEVIEIVQPETDEYAEIAILPYIDRLTQAEIDSLALSAQNPVVTVESGSDLDLLASVLRPVLDAVRQQYGEGSVSLQLSYIGMGSFVPQEAALSGIEFNRGRGVPFILINQEIVIDGITLSPGSIYFYLGDIDYLPTFGYLQPIVTEMGLAQPILIPMHASLWDYPYWGGAVERSIVLPQVAWDWIGLLTYRDAMTSNPVAFAGRGVEGQSVTVPFRATDYQRPMWFNPNIAGVMFADQVVQPEVVATLSPTEVPVAEPPSPTSETTWLIKGEASLGTLAVQDETDTWLIEVPAGNEIGGCVTSLSADLSFTMAVMGPAGNQLVLLDSVHLGTQTTNPQNIIFTVPVEASGTYKLVVTSSVGTGDYIITAAVNPEIACVLPPYP